MSIDDTFGPLSNYEDVAAFHAKFGLEYTGPSRLLDDETAAFRVKFLEEELTEYINAVADKDIVGAADALVDLVYVAMGTSLLHGFPWQPLWEEVQRANLSKVRASHKSESKRGSSLDVVKPEGWKAPDIEGVLARHGK